IYERAGAARGLVDAKANWMKTRDLRRKGREDVARDLRRQIEDLRAQLGRYAEALEEDLSAGREKVAGRAREGLNYEKQFQEASNILINNLKGRPECRDLMNKLTSGTLLNGQDNNNNNNNNNGGQTPDRRTEI